MKKLELKHLAPYLPYDLQVSVRTRHDKGERIGRICELTNKSNHSDWVKVWFDDVYTFINTNTFEDSSSNSHYFFFGQDVIKPMLRPISDLFSDKLNPIPINETKHLYGCDYLWCDVYKKKEPFNCNALNYAVLSKLIEWHFDIFGLIDAGLAIDINSVNSTAVK